MGEEEQVVKSKTNDFGIPDHVKTAINADVRALLEAFRQQSSGLGYAAFSRCWRQMNFSMIHFCCNGRDRRRAVLRWVMDSTVGLLATSPHLNVFVFVVYTLYALFTTQLLTPRVLVEVEENMWELMLQLHQVAVNKTLFDVDYAFHRLVYNHPDLDTVAPVTFNATNDATGLAEVRKKQHGCIVVVSRAPEALVRRRKKGETAGEQAERVDRAGEIPKQLWTEAHGLGLLTASIVHSDVDSDLKAAARSYFQARQTLVDIMPDSRLTKVNPRFVQGLEDLFANYATEREKRLARLSARANCTQEPGSRPNKDLHQAALPLLAGYKQPERSLGRRPTAKRVKEMDRAVGNAKLISMQRLLAETDSLEVPESSSPSE